MSPEDALLELIAQHDKLREMMDHCEDLADEMDARPEENPLPLTRFLAKLRVAFDAHNVFEERELRPLLLARDPHSETRLARMMEDHVEEHRVIRQRLGGSATAALRDVIDTLRAHLEAEERYLLHAQVLRTAAR